MSFGCKHDKMNAPNVSQFSNENCMYRKTFPLSTLAPETFTIPF
jgi:hypothetical protein